MIGEIIAKLRKENKISRYQLAKKLNVSDQAIKYWEEGVNEPKASYIKKIAIFFDVSTDYLLEMEDTAGRKIYETPPQGIAVTNDFRYNNGTVTQNYNNK